MKWSTQPFTTYASATLPPDSLHQKSAVNKVWCISATWYCYMLNLGLHWPDTECSPSPEDDIPARVASKQERKITCIVIGSLWKYIVSKAILRTLFRNKILQTTRCTCKHNMI
ncbi:hypothetical protein QTP88_012869 [Uroleucon formosanum]